jgi:hypothetical protein
MLYLRNEPREAYPGSGRDMADRIHGRRAGDFGIGLYC